MNEKNVMTSYSLIVVLTVIENEYEWEFAHSYIYKILFMSVYDLVLPAN